MRIYAHMNGDLIDNVIVIDPANCGNFRLDGYIDITDVTPRPGIDWKRTGSTWSAPILPDFTTIPITPVAMPQPTPDTNSVPNTPKHDTVEIKEQDDGPTRDNRPAATEGDGL